MKILNRVFVYFYIFFLTGCANDNAIVKNQENFISDTVVSGHFTFILYDGLSETIKEPVLKKLQENYSRVLDDLKITAMGKVTIKIWNDEAHYLDDQQRDIGVRYPGSSGYVFGPYEIRLLNRENLAQNTLHEFCHAASLVVNRNFANNPRWFWEVVAIYESGGLINPRSLSYLVSGNFPTIAELNSDFNAGNFKIYQVGYLLSEYILANWGNNRYLALIKNGANIQDALEITIQQFETGWKQYVQTKYLD